MIFQLISFCLMKSRKSKAWISLDIPGLISHWGSAIAWNIWRSCIKPSVSCDTSLSRLCILSKIVHQNGNSRCLFAPNLPDLKRLSVHSYLMGELWIRDASACREYVGPGSQSFLKYRWNVFESTDMGLGGSLCSLCPTKMYMQLELLILILQSVAMQSCIWWGNRSARLTLASDKCRCRKTWGWRIRWLNSSRKICNWCRWLAQGLSVTSERNGKLMLGDAASGSERGECSDSRLRYSSLGTVTSTGRTSAMDTVRWSWSILNLEKVFVNGTEDGRWGSNGFEYNDVASGCTAQNAVKSQSRKLHVSLMRSILPCHSPWSPRHQSKSCQKYLLSEHV